jgi:NADH-ubiquinone oxidoreductase chain 1
MLNIFFPCYYFLAVDFCYGWGSFLTLLERKVLGYIHIHKGPNKVGFVGIFQPFRDAIRLFTREQYFPLVSHYLLYYFSPVFGFFLSLLV